MTGEPAPQVEPLVREVQIDAAPETVFEFFVDPDKVTRWLAAEATLDPRPGGTCHQVHVDDGVRYTMRGEFLAVEPPGRVVFTWGFDEPQVNVPPGSSVVEVTFTPQAGGTLVRLVHTGLPASEVPSHADGWSGLLARLAALVAGVGSEAR